MKSVSIIIPIYKPNKEFKILLDKLLNQSVEINEIIIIHTDIGDDISYLYEIEKVKIINITKDKFNHANTRNLGAEKSSSEFFLFMTQDAIPYDKFLVENLLKAFENEQVGCAYARQVPRAECEYIERYNRQFNYPPYDIIKTKKSLGELGISAIFNSNVCSMYRNDIFKKVGGFRKNSIFNEDSLIAYDLLTDGFTVYYKSDALVIHSHNFNLKKLAKRYFDLGISHENNKEIYDKYKSESRGIKLLFSTIKYLIKNKKIYLIPKSIALNFNKYLFYKLGRCYKKLPKCISYKLSNNLSTLKLYN